MRFEGSDRLAMKEGLRQRLRPTRLLRRVSRWGCAGERRQVQLVTDKARDDPRKPSQQTDRVLNDGVKHRLLIRRRTADHPQDFAGRRLLLQRLGKIAV